MARVYIGKDSCYSLFVWDEEMFKLLPQPEKFIVEVPDAILDEYRGALLALRNAEDKIGKYYREYI